MPKGDDAAAKVSGYLDQEWSLATDYFFGWMLEDGPVKVAKFSGELRDMTADDIRALSDDDLRRIAMYAQLAINECSIRGRERAIAQAEEQGINLDEE